MYREEGYTASEAVRSIFQNNLFGLDIDPRAAQLATFALLLKAAAQDRSILTSNLLPHVYAMPEKEIFTKQEVLDFLGEAHATHAEALYNALELMQQSQNLGSIMKFNFSDNALAAIAQQTTAWKALQPTDILQQDLWKRLAPYMQVLQVLTTKYEAVAANPPYLGPRNMNTDLKEYVDTHYSLSKSDLFAVFIELCLNKNFKNGKIGIVNQESWLFNSSYKMLRKKIVLNYHVESLIHLGTRAFDELSGEKVRSVTFILNNSTSSNEGIYFKLTEQNNSNSKNKAFLNQKNRFDNINQKDFLKIEGSPFAYWISPKVLSLFNKSKNLSNYSEPRKGNSTSDNDRFLKLWFELDLDKSAFCYNDVNKALSDNKYWIAYNKGGGTRKWYGQNEYFIDWRNNGEEIRKIKTAVVTNEKYYMKPGLTWSAISSKKFGLRYFDEGFIFDNNGCCLFELNENRNFLAGLLNSKVFFHIIGQLNPALAFHPGDVKKFPVIHKKIDETISICNLTISKSDWDSRETSWDFETHPLIKTEQTNLQSAYQAWVEQVTHDFYQLHANETELNRIFIDIYGLQDELTPAVKLKDITILQEELNSNALGDATEPIGTLPIKQDVVMRQLISYLMGCLMGRYRLDKSGLHIAHPAPSAEETAAYTYHGYTVEIDDDGIIPLMDSSSSFADNALIRIKHLLEAQWGGDKQLVDTINYLQAALGKDLETYLVKDFWKDHCSRYQKRPIYWLFASPNRAFQVITYMHRMNKYTVEKIRSKYLLVHIRNLENQYSALKANDANLTRDEAKRLEKVEKDLIECRDYDLLLKDVADHQIDFDLDDGVVVNYAKFEGVVAPIK